MKKLLAILALTAAGIAQAGDSVTLENARTEAGTATQNTVALVVKHDLNSTYAIDGAFLNTQTEGTNALGTRLEAGLTASAPLYGSVKGYVRTAMGQKYSNTKDFTYYSVEPGVLAPVGPVTVKVGFRFRDATHNGVANKDQTRTARVTVSYPVTKSDTVYVRFDDGRGDTRSTAWALGLAHAF